MPNRIPPLLVAAALLGVGAAPARAQDATVDPRWLAYLGCWRSVGTPATLCLLPSVDAAAVELVLVENEEVVTTEQILATGQRIMTARGDCAGWQSAEWSTVSDRLYLRSEESCPGGGTRAGSGVIGMTRDGHLLYIQGSSVARKTGVRVQRFMEATVTIDLPSEVSDALHRVQPDLIATAQARAAASAPLAVEDLVEATRRLDAGVTEAWLIERGGTFKVDAELLTQLSQAGVPPQITDLLIALSNPQAFKIDVASHTGARRVDPEEANVGIGTEPMYPFNPAYRDCLAYSPFGYGYGMYYCDGSMTPYPFGYYWSPFSYPVTISYTGSAGGSGRAHGRVVNGRGYREGPRPGTDTSGKGESRPRDWGTGSSSGSGSGSSSASPASSGARTAKPRP